MTKENIITPVIVIGLSLAFITVSLLVSVFYKNPKLIKAKLKIGALIITLTACSSTYSFSQKTCYKPSLTREIISVDSQSENSTITIHENDKELTGKIANLSSTDYSFSISDTLGKTIQKGTLKAIDGKFDTDEENFIIHFGKLKEGQYVLKIFSTANKNSFLYTATLKVFAELDRTKVTCYYY